MAIKPLIASSKERPPSEVNRYTGSQELDAAIKQSVDTTSLLLIGALIQGTIVLSFPRVWALLPTILILLARFSENLAITFKFKSNPYLTDVIQKRFATVIPDADGNISAQPASDKVAILILSLKINHPLGLFAPNVAGINEWQGGMMKELDKDAKTNGFLAQTTYQGRDSRGAPEIMLLSYWRSVEDIHNYAEGPLHRKALAWWEKMTKAQGMEHIGISHEIFEAPASRWEALQMNSQPARMGLMSFFKKGDKEMGGTVEDEWMGAIVPATGKWKSSRGRLNWSQTS